MRLRSVDLGYRLIALARSITYLNAHKDGTRIYTPWSSGRTSCAAIEKRVFPTAERWSWPSETKSMRSRSFQGLQSIKGHSAEGEVSLASGNSAPY